MLGNFKRVGKTFSCQELVALDHDFVSFLMEQSFRMESMILRGT